MLTQLGLRVVRTLTKNSTAIRSYHTKKPIEKFYKITNAEEKHEGFQYRDGLNILEEKFNDDPKSECGPGGLYFTSAKNILEYMGYGPYLRPVKLPWNNPNFKFMKVNDQYRANMLILGERRDLYSVNTLKMLSRQGVDLRIHNDELLRRAAEHGHLYAVKYLLKRGADINAENVFPGTTALASAAGSGHLHIVDFLFKNGADIRALRDSALINSAAEGHSEIVKFLLDRGADVHAYNDSALFHAVTNRHLDVVKILIGAGANANRDDEDIKSDNMLTTLGISNDLEMLKILVEAGANIYASNNEVLKLSMCHDNIQIVEYLVEKGADIKSAYEYAVEHSINNSAFSFIKNLIEKN